MSQTLHFGADLTCTCQHSAAWSSWPDGFIRSVRLLMHAVYRWIDQSRQRQALKDLDDHLLKDIGISRATAMKEAVKSFWM